MLYSYSPAGIILVEYTRGLDGAIPVSSRYGHQREDYISELAEVFPRTPIHSGGSHIQCIGWRGTWVAAVA